MPEPICLQLDEITKTYPNGTRALSGVSLTVRAGSIHGLVGGNGAGKSTLIKVLAGAISADGGDVVWKGERVEWTSPGAATRAGLATIHQTVPLVPTLSVLENVELASSGFSRIPSGARSSFDALLERMNYRIDPDRRVDTLSIGARQMVAILQALAAGASAIVMDEPTASLAAHEREVVFETVRRLAASGTAFIYVSHFLDEVLQLTDEITVIRDGRVVDAGLTSEFGEQRLAEAIAGRRLTSAEGAVERDKRVPGDIVVSAERVGSPSGVIDVSLQVCRGEILGIAGLMGSGRSELLHILFGSDPDATGVVTIGGRRVANSVAARMRAGLALVPEERLRMGLIGAFEIWRNMTLASLSLHSMWRIFPDRRAERAAAQDQVARLRIKTDSVERSVDELSGGNAQKVLFSKWLLGAADVYLLDEPFHGIDVGAKAEIVELIRDLADSGKTIVVVDSELHQLHTLCDRVVVMRRGRLVAELDVADVTDHELLLMASGIDVREETHVF